MILPYKNKKPAVTEAVFIAPNATLIGDITLGKNCSVWFGAVIRGDNAAITIGAESNIQDNAVLHVDPGLPLCIGSKVTIGHNAVLHGCTIGDNTVIGMGAVILNKAKIGENSIVGAGALVPENAEYPPGSLITGNPALVKKSLKPAHLHKIGEAARQYVEHGLQMKQAIPGE